jgi:hypothetical protein
MDPEAQGTHLSELEAQPSERLVDTTAGMLGKFQVMTCTNHERLEAGQDMKVSQERMREDQEQLTAEMKTNQEEMQARTEANQRMMDGWMDVHQEGMKAAIKSDQEEIKATINSFRYDLEETMKYRVEDILTSVDRHKAYPRNLTRRLMKRRCTYR